MKTGDLNKALYLIGSLNPSHTKLHKLLYICELIFIDKYSKRFTEFDFIHYQHGPYINGLLDTLLETSNVSYKDEYSLTTTVKIESIKMNENEKEVIDFVINKYGRMPLGEKNGGGILNYVYHTIPFIETHFNDTIDFNQFIGFHISEVMIKNTEYKRIKKRVVDSEEIFKYMKSENGIKKISEEVNAYLKN